MIIDNFWKIKDEKGEFSVSNGIIGFKFIKNREYAGKFEIDFNYNNEFECFLKDCYSALNFYSSYGSKKIFECSSKEYVFNHDIKKIEDSMGNGLNIVFNSINKSDQMINFKIQFKIYEKKDFILIKIIDIVDKSQNPLPVHSISPLTIKKSSLFLTGSKTPSNLKNISFFKQGFQSWTPCRLLFGNEKDRRGPPLRMFKRVLDNQDYDIKGRFYSEYCTAITDLNSKISLVLGFVTLKDQFSRIILDFKDSKNIRLLTALGCMDRVTLPASSIDFSEELFVEFKLKNLGYSGLIEYAKVIKANIRENRITEVPKGWCSWYYYFTRVTQEDIVKNLEFFNNNKDTLPIDFVQLDDGYFTEIGDYNRHNSKFSQGLNWLFEKIKNAGFKGGIWTAPFFAVKNSELFQNHTDWFLNKIGTTNLVKAHFNWGSFLFSLDLTNEEVIGYISNFYSNLLYAFEKDRCVKGENLIDFFKIDFIHAAVPFDGDYKDKTLTRAELFYNGIKAIREGITDKTFLLGCGAPLGPCVGIVDAMRISTDTGPKWATLDKISKKLGFGLPCLKAALLNIIYRSFMHKYLWINDPDCLMIRRTDTKLTVDEIRLQITIFGLSGGQILISDDMTKLTEEEIADAKLIIPPYNPKGFDSIPINALSSNLPSIYVLKSEEVIGKRYLVSIINWENEIATISKKIYDLLSDLPPSENLFYVYDFWNRKFLGEFKLEDLIEFKEVHPHSCVFLNIIPINEEWKKKPVLLSTTLHFSQGCCEVKKFEYINEKNLQIDINLIGKRKGALLLKFPEGRKISTSNTEFNQIDDKRNIWDLYIEFKDEISLKIELA